MIAIVFVSIFFGSLSAASLLFSGWPLWYAAFVYLFSGLLGIGMMLLTPHIRPAVVARAECFARYLSQLKYWKQTKQTNLEPEPVPDLSEYLFHSRRH